MVVVICAHILCYLVDAIVDNDVAGMLPVSETTTDDATLLSVQDVSVQNRHAWNDGGCTFWELCTG